MMLCTADGYPVLSTDGQPIVLSSDYNAANIKVSSEGDLMYPGEDGNLANIGVKIGLSSSLIHQVLISLVVTILQRLKHQEFQ